VQLVLCATPSDHERFVALGADPTSTLLTGSLKLDVKVGPALTAEERTALRQELGFISTSAAQPVLVILGSSTWPGEEAVLLEVLNDALTAGLDAHLLLVPRHAERRRELMTWLEKQPLPFHVRSQSVQAPRPVKIYLGDTTGELARLSQAADVAFIGKSLPPNEGGQTPIEAAALGLPLVFGPNMSNFKDISRQLVETGAARRVQDTKEAKANLLGLLQDPMSRARMGSAGRAWHTASQGATARTAAALVKLLD
jgi:3-deoxy-D-manno-octulosonic-acid transferase